MGWRENTRDEKESPLLIMRKEKKKRAVGGKKKKETKGKNTQLSSKGRGEFKKETAGPIGKTFFHWSV